MTTKEQEILEFIEDETQGKIDYVYKHEVLADTYVGISNGLALSHEFIVETLGDTPEIVYVRRI